MSQEQGNIIVLDLLTVVSDLDFSIDTGNWTRTKYIIIANLSCWFLTGLYAYRNAIPYIKFPSWMSPMTQANLMKTLQNRRSIDSKDTRPLHVFLSRRHKVWIHTNEAPCRHYLLRLGKSYSKVLIELYMGVLDFKVPRHHKLCSKTATRYTAKTVDPAIAKKVKKLIITETSALAQKEWRP